MANTDEAIVHRMQQLIERVAEIPQPDGTIKLPDLLQHASDVERVGLADWILRQLQHSSGRSNIVETRRQLSKQTVSSELNKVPQCNVVIVSDEVQCNLSGAAVVVNERVAGAVAIYYQQKLCGFSVALSAASAIVVRGGFRASPVA